MQPTIQNQNSPENIPNLFGLFVSLLGHKIWGKVKELNEYVNKKTGFDFFAQVSKTLMSGINKLVEEVQPEQQVQVEPLASPLQELINGVLDSGEENTKLIDELCNIRRVYLPKP